MDLHTHHGSRMHPKTSSNDDDEFLEWCGGLSSVSWLPLGPCYTESYAAVFFLCLVLVSLLAQGGHLALIHQLKATGRHRKGVSGLNGAYIGLVSNLGTPCTIPLTSILRAVLACVQVNRSMCFIIYGTLWARRCCVPWHVATLPPETRCHVSFLLRRIAQQLPRQSRVQFL